MAQAEYKAEVGLYADISQDLDQTYPSPNPGPHVTQWGGPCSGCKDPNGWRKLKVEVSAPVMYGYATVAGVGAGAATGSSPPPNSFAKASPSQADALSSQKGKLKSTDPFFVAVAKGDTDGNGEHCTVLGLSHSNQLIVSNEGE
jgi:hypothetical protein